MHRLFVALRPPLAVREALSQTMAGVSGARWQDDGQLHLTLRFIGEVERRQAEEVALVLGSIRADALDLAVAGVGAFDSRGRPNALWAGVTPQAPLAHLHRKIDQALVRIGLEPERRAYLPHVTLARLNASAGAADGWLADHAALAGPPFRIDQFLLYESHLGRAAASYDAIARYPLS